MADDALEVFWEDLESGEVHIRDKWQFSLKSEFFPQKSTKPSQYIQEFYLFIPKSLQIDANTYTKAAFYLDQTNLIRYKTPEFSFEELLNPHQQRSPLTRITFLCNQTDSPENRTALSDELKLLANIVRSTLRREVKELMKDLANKDPSNILRLCHSIERLRERYANAEKQCLDNWRDPLFYRQMLYIDEFMSYSISYYLTGLLESVRFAGLHDTDAIDQALCDVLLKEKQLSDLLTHTSTEESERERESVLYRYSLLNKFVLGALYLYTNRFSLDQQYQHWIAGVSAGIAMFIYFSLFIWLGNIFVINSAPFVILTVVCYILKDRIKEWLRTLSYLHASKWFPDYTTLIQSNKGKIGVIKESFSFLETPQLSEELKNVRNAEFHSVLETLPRTESVLFYKRIVEIHGVPANGRRYGVNLIFRFNIYEFLRKASDPSEVHLMIDPNTKKLVRIHLPKVYHLNLIIRSTSIEEGKPPTVELKKLRIVIDKKGIKRIEQLPKVK